MTRLGLTVVKVSLHNCRPCLKIDTLNSIYPAFVQIYFSEINFVVLINQLVCTENVKEHSTGGIDSRFAIVTDGRRLNIKHYTLQIEFIVDNNALDDLFQKVYQSWKK